MRDVERAGGKGGGLLVKLVRRGTREGHGNRRSMQRAICGIPLCSAVIGLGGTTLVGARISVMSCSSKFDRRNCWHRGCVSVTLLCFQSKDAISIAKFHNVSCHVRYCRCRPLRYLSILFSFLLKASRFLVHDCAAWSDLGTLIISETAMTRDYVSVLYFEICYSVRLHRFACYTSPSGTIDGSLRHYRTVSIVFVLVNGLSIWLMVLMGPGQRSIFYLRTRFKRNSVGSRLRHASCIMHDGAHSMCRPSVPHVSINSSICTSTGLYLFPFLLLRCIVKCSIRKTSLLWFEFCSLETFRDQTFSIFYYSEKGERAISLRWHPAIPDIIQTRELPKPHRFCGDVSRASRPLAQVAMKC